MTHFLLQIDKLFKKIDEIKKGINEIANGGKRYESNINVPLSVDEPKKNGKSLPLHLKRMQQIKRFDVQISSF